MVTATVAGLLTAPSVAQYANDTLRARLIPLGTLAGVKVNLDRVELMVTRSPLASVSGNAEHPGTMPFWIVNTLPSGDLSFASTLSVVDAETFG
jgi:hypothetical protein